MYGGASLAIYENGAAQELFRAVKGEGVYGLLKRLVDSEIYIDILSVTSAGGINGILLSYALANSKDFRATAELWRKNADILKLLGKPRDPNTLSLLDGEGFFQSALEEAMGAMPEYIGKRFDSELDLFVTVTDFYGRVLPARDGLGHEFGVKDHRAVFVLSYGGERKNEFAPTQCSRSGETRPDHIVFPRRAPVHIGARRYRPSAAALGPPGTSGLFHRRRSVRQQNRFHL